MDAKEIDSSSIVDQTSITSTMKVVVVGNGMVGHRFVEKMVEFIPQESRDKVKIIVFGEEKYRAYDRVHLTSYFEHTDPTQLEFETEDWYIKNGIELTVGDPVVHIDRKSKVVQSKSGKVVEYDHLVLATGSVPYSPPIDGADNLKGVFVYRTISDLDSIIEWATVTRKVSHAIVLGGGLLGLEAAQVCKDLPGIQSVRIVHRRPYLMNRQVDPKGGEVLGDRIISTVGAILSLGCHITKVLRDEEHGRINGVEIANFGKGNNKKNGSDNNDDDQEFSVVPCEMLILAVGIRPRDELVRSLEDISIHESGGGLIVDDTLSSISDSSIHGVGECVNHRGLTYGLVAPGYEMADVLARKLSKHKEQKSFNGGDESTKLKLLGVDVASFGRFSDSAEDPSDMKSLRFHDPFSSIYRRLFFNKEGTHLLGGILVGDASDYAKLLMLCRGAKVLKVSPSELILPPSITAASGKGSGEASGNVDDMEDSDKVCSCNDVSKGAIACAIKDKGCDTMGKIQACTKAGAGCGGCKPLIEAVLKSELLKSGKKVSNDICAHFGYTRKELFNICKVKHIKSYDELHQSHGRNSPLGCEICKPAVASILASIGNEFILKKDHAILQDTNDRFLANVQRGGTYSVVPRIPGGEITPERIITLGIVAKKYGLYTKITGGQRIDMFGAKREQLPEIWKDLVDAGFESGHAYGKSLRTVKSCVGSTWCRYGMLDSVGMAVKLEERYKGVRAPHKVKFAVSGCTRDCAEMHNKDFGLVATANGYDILVCGNGGMKPRLGDLLISGVSEEKAIQIIDRAFMYYISTADRLERTARWIEKMPRGIEDLKDIILNDSLKICDELEKQMQYLISTYKCEWKEVVMDEEKQAWFKQFVNTEETQEGIELVDNGRGQKEPAKWPNEQEKYPKIELELLPSTLVPSIQDEQKESEEKTVELNWTKVAMTSDVPKAGGVTVLYGQSQIAVFEANGKYYATQNVCPHRNSPSLSSGIIGEFEGVPKVACPIHKKTYSLETGKGLDGNSFNIATFPVQVMNENEIHLLLPSTEVLDMVLSMEKLKVKKQCDDHACSDERLQW